MARKQDSDDQNQGSKRSGDKNTASREEPIVKTTTGEPDLRIKENREKFLKDPEATVDGDPDRRFKENRPDLQELEERRGTGRSNVKE